MKRERDHALRLVKNMDEMFSYLEKSIVRTIHLKDETRVYINCNLDELKSYKARR